MRDVLAKMQECGKYVEMRDFPHDCRMAGTYDMQFIASTEVMYSLKYIISSWENEKKERRFDHVDYFNHGLNLVTF